MITYLLPDTSERVVLTKVVVDHLSSHRQTRCWHREAGGQLFARFDDAEIVVKRATGPRATDRRTRRSYRPDRKAEQREIFDMHAHGLH